MTTNGRSPDASTPPLPEPLEQSQTGRIAVTLIVTAMIVMWTWIWFFAPRDNPDRFSDTAYAEAAEPVCAAAHERIDALPPGRDAESPQERAIWVREATLITEELVADLKALMSLVDDPQDRATLLLWFEDWEDGYIVDRWRHVERLENATGDFTSRDLAFQVQDRAEGGHYTRRIDGLANVNDMASCHVPGDI